MCPKVFYPEDESDDNTVPDVINSHMIHSMQKLVGEIGPIVASEVLLRGAPLSTRRAQELGLVNQGLPRDCLETETAALAGELAANAPLVVRAFKLGIRRTSQADAERYRHDMYDVMVRVMNSEDAREGSQAFREKRSPQYTGHESIFEARLVFMANCSSLASRPRRYGMSGRAPLIRIQVQSQTKEPEREASLRVVA